MTVLAIFASSLVFVISLITLCNIIHALHTGGKSMYFDGMNYHGTYLAEMKLGEPPQKAHLALSTAGSSSWVMGYPCDTCSKLKVSFYNPNNSTTYSNVPCKSKSCRSIRRFPCDSAVNRFCKYHEHRFGRYITASGNLASETVHFKNTNGMVSLAGIILGCTHEIKIRPGTMGQNNLGSGYMELSNHHNSVINHAYRATDGEVPRRFSYCFPLEENESSRTYIGHTPPSKKVSHTTTPLYISHSNHYYLRLINIGIEFEDTTPVHIAVTQDEGLQSSTKGNILVDTASPITFIMQFAMEKVESEVLKGMRLDRVDVPKDSHPAINICFNWNERNDSEVPEITFIFENDAKIITGAVFEEIEDDVLCLLMASDKFSTESAPVLGIGAQIEHRLEFDLDKKEVKITPDECESRE